MRAILLSGVMFATALLSGCAWYPKQMDDEITSLRKEIEDKRNVLADYASPYRAIEGQHFQIEISQRPLRETIHKFNTEVSHTLAMVQTSASGKIAEAWTDCPWPLSGHLGVSLEPWPYAAGFGAVVYIHRLDYGPWDAIAGPQIRFVGTAGAGYMIVIGWVEFCVGKLPILPIPIVVVGGGFDNRTEAVLTPVAGEGIRYTYRLIDPLWFLAVANVVGWNIPVPFSVKPDLFSGILPNLVGKEGEIRIMENGIVRKYSIDASFERANYIVNGLTASGKFNIIWQ